MCKFFSCISDGNGKVLFFTLEQIQKIEQEGNPNHYESWNSHTSIANYNGLTPLEEDKWNKWEYNNETKELEVDGNLVTKDDSILIKPIIEEYIAKNNALYLQKVFNMNFGNSNSGNRNSGDSNSGDRNSGDSNSGDRNSGDWNSGYWNSGDSNSGNGNSGNGNSGYRNSGNWNSGNWNSGNGNSGYFNINTPKVRIFGKETKIKIEDIKFPKYFYFDLTTCISVSEMTADEKTKFWWHKTTDGYLRTIEYKEAWKMSFEKATKEDVELTLKLPNFNHKIFEEITGITKKMITIKLGIE